MMGSTEKLSYLVVLLRRRTCCWRRTLPENNISVLDLMNITFNKRPNGVKRKNATHSKEGGVTLLIIEKEAAKMKRATT